MNIYKDRLWLALLTGIVSLCMGFSEFYTWRIGWHPGSSPWNREALLHGLTWWGCWLFPSLLLS